MNPSLFAALLSIAGVPMPNPRVKVCANPQFTKEAMVTRKQISGMELECISRNPQGDCLCIGELKEIGAFMVDLDHRYIARKETP